MPTSNNEKTCWQLNLQAMALYDEPLSEGIRNAGPYDDDTPCVEAKESTEVSNYLFFSNDSQLTSISATDEWITATNESIVLFGANDGKLCYALLEKGRQVVLLETDPQRLVRLFSQYDISQALTEKQLIILSCNFTSARLDEVSRLSLSAQFIHYQLLNTDFLIEEGRVEQQALQSLFTSLTSLPDTLPHGEAENDLSSGDSRSSYSSNSYDIAVVSPGCAIFHDLARCFETLGYKTKLLNITDNNQNRMLAKRLELHNSLEHTNARLTLLRNRCGIERDANSLQPSNANQLGAILSWWWDMPNISSYCDLKHECNFVPSLAFAKGALPVLPAGSQWLPPGARPDFCAFDDGHRTAKTFDISFVGQARTDVLKNNIPIIVQSFYSADKHYAKQLQQTFNNTANIIETYQQLVQNRTSFLQQLQLHFTHLPDHDYFLRYLWDMCETAAFRLAAVCFIINSGFALQVFGDKQWLTTGIVPKELFHGVIEPDKLPTLYAASRINLNLNFMQVSTTVNPKVLDIAAVGAPILTDYRPELDTLFPDPQRRPFSFKQLNEIPEILRQLLSTDSQQLTQHSAAIAQHTREQHSLLIRAQWIADRFLA